MADAIATLALFTGAFGWLINKGRSIASRNLRRGDVCDRLLCGLVASEHDNVKSKLDGLARQHLGAAISSYNEGVNHLRDEKDELDGPGPAKRKKLDFFGKAREKASDAFGNPGLSPENRISAARIRVMARLLETVDDPAEALISCKQYLEEMHAMEEVKSNSCLKLHGSPLKKRLVGSRLNSIIGSVYQVNRIVFGVTQMIGVGNDFFVWPSVTCKCGRKVDPLRDPKFRETARKQAVDMDVIWTFGQQDKEAENRLKSPRGIAANAQDEYLVVDSTDTKVFDSNGKYPYSLTDLLGNPKFKQYHTVDIDADQNGKVYLLVRMVKRRAEDWYEVFVLDENLRLHKFPLRNKSKGLKIAVNQHRDKTELLVLEGETGLHAMVEVYETDGTFVCQFGERILQDAQDIVGTNEGHVYVLDKCHESEKKFIREFGESRDHLRSFDVASESVAIAFHRPSQHIVVISTSSSKELELSVYNIKKELVHSGKVPNSDGRERVAQNVTVTIKGRIVVVAVVIGMNSGDEQQGEVIVY